MLNLVLTMLALEVLSLLLLRPLLMWYLKINRALRLLQSIDQSLKVLPAVREYHARLRKAS